MKLKGRYVTGSLGWLEKQRRGRYNQDTLHACMYDIILQPWYNLSSHSCKGHVLATLS